jgi:uncharacterized integral membrane protein (TIGR00698 family)
MARIEHEDEMHEDHTAGGRSAGRQGLHEDVAAILIGLAAVLLALALTWAARPAEDAASRERYPKGWPTPLAATVGAPGGWTDRPLAAFTDSGGRPAVGPILGGMGWVLLAGGLGALLTGRSLRRFLPGGLVLAVLACLALLLTGQQQVKHYHLEYPLWALAVGLLVGNLAGLPRWFAPALIGEFFIKTGLVVFGAEVLVTRLVALGPPGLMTAGIVTPIVLVTTYLLGVHVLRIPSRSLCMTLSADMSVCGVSAAIATGAACRAKKEEISLVIGISLLFTVIMMVAMPPVIRLAGIDPIVGGAWIGGTIDATGAVIAAGESIGKEAGEVAATVKMIQNSMIGFIAFAVAAYWAGWIERDPAGPRGTLAGEAWRRFPRFILGFLGASLLCSAFHALGTEQALWVEGSTTGFTAKLRGWLFCTGFVCMGLQTNVRELAPVLASGRPVVLYVVGQALNLALTLAMASLTFGWLFRP